MNKFVSKKKVLIFYKMYSLLYLATCVLYISSWFLDKSFIIKYRILFFTITVGFIVFSYKLDQEAFSSKFKFLKNKWIAVSLLLLSFFIGFLLSFVNKY